MASDGEGSVTRWVSGLKAGDPEAATQLWQRYFVDLVRLARPRLRDISRAPADEEDVALSAFDSLCRVPARGDFPGSRIATTSGGCWSPLPRARPPTRSGTRRGSSGAVARSWPRPTSPPAPGGRRAGPGPRGRAEPRAGGPPRRAVPPPLRPAPRRAAPPGCGAQARGIHRPRGGRAALLRPEHRRAAAQDRPHLLGGVGLRLDPRHGSES